MIGAERGHPYRNPYLAGVVLGLLVATAYAMGKWFGASAVFVNLARYLRGDAVTRNVWMNWEVLGLGIGGLVGAVASRRFAIRFTRGPRTGRLARVAAAFLGGVLCMLGSRLAGGCTSGLALSGGVALSPGAYVFMAAMFGGGFAAAAVGRRLWS